MNWIEELTVKRNAQATNVYLVETMDFSRIAQLEAMLVNGDFEELTGTELSHHVEHDIQLQRSWELRKPLQSAEEGVSRTELPQDPVGPYAQLDRMLREQPTAAVVRFAVLPVHGEMLSNPVVPWSHSDDLYARHSTVVIFTAGLGLFNENVRRLCHQITIPPSSREEREKCLGKQAEMLSKMWKRKYNQNVSIPWNGSHVQAASGLTLHDIETAALESYFLHRAFDVRVFTDYKVKILKNYGMDWVQPTRGFESVGGYDYLKDYVRQRVIRVLTTPAVAQKYGLEIPRGLLLIGPPGTGKTYFSKAIAKESNMPMLKVSSADFLRGIVGETESRVKQLTTLIESLTPCIVFLDEFDQLALRRDAQLIGDSGVSRRMQNLLLDWLGDEARASFVVGATNFVDLDPAFIRPGRIDEIVLVLPPDLDARAQILQVHVQQRHAPVRDVDLKEIAGKTHMWSGAELARLVKEASALAMERGDPEVTMGHFDDAVKSFEVNTQERANGIQGMIAKLKTLEQVNQRFLDIAVQAFQSREQPEARLKGLLDAMQPKGVSV